MENCRFVERKRKLEFYPKIYLDNPNVKLGATKAQTGIIRPFCGALQASNLQKPSRNTSKIPGFSLAMSLWTVSTSDAE